MILEIHYYQLCSKLVFNYQNAQQVQLEIRILLKGAKERTRADEGGLRRTRADPAGPKKNNTKNTCAHYVQIRTWQHQKCWFARFSKEGGLVRLDNWSALFTSAAHICTTENIFRIHKPVNAVEPLHCARMWSYCVCSYTICHLLCRAIAK